MFPADPCAAGERRQPIHALFATNKAYAGIQFLRLPVQERALVKPAWPQDGAPFFLCDDHARLVHGQTLATQQRLRARLPALSHHPGN
jgi:hypothetical protein